MPAVPVLHYWYSALSSELGIELVCSDADSVRSRLYAARREAKDTDLDGVAICISPFDPMRLWLVKRSTTDEKT
jgi:hypothetical protein